MTLLRLCASLSILAAPTLARADDPIRFDFMAEDSDMSGESIADAPAPLPDDAALPQRIWHAATDGAGRPCPDEDYAVCAGEILALVGDAQRHDLYVGILSVLPGEQHDTAAIEAVEQAAGHSDDDAAQMVAAVSEWVAANAALREERDALVQALGAEVASAEALLARLGEPADEVLQQKIALLREELAAYRLQFPDLDTPRAAAPKDTQRPRDLVDARIERLSSLVFEIYTVDAAMSQQQAGQTAASIGR